MIPLPLLQNYVPAKPSGLALDPAVNHFLEVFPANWDGQDSGGNSSIWNGENYSMWGFDPSTFRQGPVLDSDLTQRPLTYQDFDESWLPGQAAGPTGIGSLPILLASSTPSDPFDPTRAVEDQAKVERDEAAHD